jgi:hypothetical protein
MSMARWRLAACAVVVVLSLAGCATNSPPQQGARERKAAGVVLFRIHCSKDLWEQTGATGNDRFGSIPAKITNDANGLVTVELSGPNLVTLLEKLDFNAHGGEGNHNPLSARMYNAIAPRVDAIQATPRPGAPIPEVIIDDNVGGTSGPVVSPSSGK